jgi:hypothetical protein
VNLGEFFPWKILCIDPNHIFQVEIWRNIAPQKKNTEFLGHNVITYNLEVLKLLIGPPLVDHNA